LQAVNKVMQLDIHVAENKNVLSETLSDQSHPFLYFRAERKMVKVFLEDILFVESLKDYIKVVTTNKLIISKQAISSLEEMLPKEAFVRVHRSYIIAVNKIDSCNTEMIEIGKKQIPIGRLFRHDVNKVLNISFLKRGTTKQIITAKNNENGENSGKAS